MGKQRRPFKLTRAGWVFILYTIGVGAGAINTGNNLLYLVFGLFLGLLLASGVLSDLSLWGVRIEPAFPEFSTAKEVSCLPLQLTNAKKYFSSFSVVAELDGTLANQTIQLKVHIPLISAKETLSQAMMVTFPRRGVFDPTNVRLSTHYPFGLLKKWWRLNMERAPFSPVYVVPAPRAIDFDSLERRFGGVEVERVSSLRGDGGTFHNLREYQYADHPRTIDWKASAKRTALDSGRPAWVVREMEKEEKTNVVLTLPAPSEVAGLSLDEKEEIVELVYSVWESGRRQGRAVHLVGTWAAGERYFVVDVKRFVSVWNPDSFLPPDIQSLYCSSEGPLLPSSILAVSAIEVFKDHGNS